MNYQHLEEREEGIKAVIYLQKIVGIDEPRDSAGQAWDSLTEAERKKTIETYQFFKSIESK